MKVLHQPYGLRDYTFKYPVFRAWNVEKALPTVMEYLDPDIVVLQGVGDIDLARIVQLREKPVILHIRSVEFYNFSSKPNEIGFDGYVANSKFSAQRFFHAFDITPKVIFNIFDEEQYKIKIKGNKVLFVNPREIKGLNLALFLAERNPKVRFIFLESWPIDQCTQKKIEKCARELGNIEFRRSTRRMKRIFSETKLVIVPSQWEEAWGRVVSEAQISGIPAIASNVGGLPEAVGDGGILLSPDDWEAWDSALKKILQNKQYWSDLSGNALEHINKRGLDPNELTECYEKYIHEILGKKLSN